MSHALAMPYLSGKEQMETTALSSGFRVRGLGKSADCGDNWGCFGLIRRYKYAYWVNS